MLRKDVPYIRYFVALTIGLLTLTNGVLYGQWSHITDRSEEIIKTRFVTSKGPCYSSGGRTYRYDSESASWVLLMPHTMLAARDASFVTRSDFGHYLLTTDGGNTFLQLHMPYSTTYHQFLVRGDTVVVLADTAIFVSMGKDVRTWTEIGLNFPSGIHGRDIKLHWYGSNVLIEERKERLTVRCVSVRDLWIPLTEAHRLTYVSSHNDVVLFNYDGKLSFEPSLVHAGLFDIQSPRTHVAMFGNAVLVFSPFKTAISRDGGTTWHVERTFPDYPVDSLRHFTYRDSLYVYLGPTLGWRATDTSARQWSIVTMKDIYSSAKFAHVADSLLIWLNYNQLLSIPPNLQQRPRQFMVQGNYPLATITTKDGTIISFTQRQIHRSTNGGRDWETSPFEQNVKEAGYSDSFIWINDGGLRLSLDNGRTWGTVMPHTSKLSFGSASYHRGSWIYTKNDESFIRKPNQLPQTVVLPSATVIPTFSVFDNTCHIAGIDGMYQLKNEHWTFSTDTPNTIKFRSLRPNDTHYYGLDTLGRPIRWRPGTSVEVLGDIVIKDATVSFTGPYVTYTTSSGIYVYNTTPTTSTQFEPGRAFDSDTSNHHTVIVYDDILDLTSLLPRDPVAPTTTVFSMSGEAVQSTRQTWFVTTESLPRGTYILVLTQQQQTKTVLVLLP